MDDTQVEYRGYTITIEYDTDAINPFEEFDGEPPMLVAAQRYSHLPTCYGLQEDPPKLSRRKIRDNARDIALAMGHSTLLRAVREECAYHLADYDNGVDPVNDMLQDHAQGLSGADQTAVLAQCWRWYGCQALDTCVTGYTQGQYADLLLVATPEWLDRTGINPADTDVIGRQLESAAELYGQWAWGDVYGFTIYANHEPHCDAGEVIDSCWGFYGSDHEASGLLDNARSAIDCHIRARRRAHLARLKTMIRNRVPLQVRNSEFKENRA
jgi:hypothetical protein